MPAIRWRVTLTVAALSTGLLTSCSSSGSCQDFALSLVRTTGGSSSAVAAAEEFADSGSVDLPQDGWTAGARDPAGQEVTSGRATLHAVRGTDDTWFIDSGRCD